MTGTTADAPHRVARLWWAPLVVAALPVAAGLAILSRSTWYPIGDLGQANLRYLSFWSDPPLVGAAGRIVGPGGVQGNHPGPAQFWLTWPVWALLGGSSWALNVSVAVSNLAGAVVAALCARRTAGRAGGAAVAAVAAVLVAGFGPEVMLQPWNPSMPLMWFLALVVATWGVVAGHRAMLPIVAACACYVVQCHAGYAPLAVGLCGLAGGAVMVAVVRSDDRRGAAIGALPWLVGAGAVAAAMWAPTAYEQLTRDPGNVDILRYSFSHPDEDYVGFGRSLRLVLLQLDPVGGWVRGSEPLEGLPVLGGLTALAWLGTGAAAWSRLGSTWRRLDVVLAACLVGAWVSVSRIFGQPFVYLFKWTWVLAGLVLLATAAHVWTLVRGRTSLSAGRVVLGAVVVTTLIALIVGGVRYADTEVSGEVWSDTIAGLVGPTEDALDPNDSYLVAWRDPVALGGMGFGMVLELERRGFDVGVAEQFSAAGEPHRVRSPDEVDAVINVVTGQAAITEALALPGARMIAQVDPRTPAERARYDVLTERAARRLDETGFTDQADALRAEGNLFGILLSADLPPDVVADITEMVDLSLPTAVVLSDPVTL